MMKPPQKSTRIGVYKSCRLTKHPRPLPGSETKVHDTWLTTTQNTFLCVNDSFCLYSVIHTCAGFNSRNVSYDFRFFEESYKSNLIMD